ncbi:MAG: hypothetical protein GY801_47965, partial [bacterium]|nr:hypothetical protein [bacterium]
MRAKLLTIQERHRNNMSSPLTLRDFTVNDAGTIDAEFLIEMPTVSLCCLDDENGCAIFAELPPDRELSHEPFFHQAQFEHALRLIRLDYDSFHTLAGQATFQPQQLVFIHNIGRCGSTLFHHLFNRVAQVTSLSEPDALSEIHSLRAGHNGRDPEFIKLLQSSVRFLFKTANYPETHIGIIKLRNQCIDILNVFWHAFPDTSHFFVYRSAVGWVSSLHSRRLRSGRIADISLENALKWWEDYCHHPIDLPSLGLADLPAMLSSVQQLTVSWLLMMDQYMTFHEQGLIMPAIRYEELSAKRDAVLSVLFTQLGVPVKTISTA